MSLTNPSIFINHNRSLSQISKRINSEFISCDLCLCSLPSDKINAFQSNLSSSRLAFILGWSHELGLCSCSHLLKHPNVLNRHHPGKPTTLSFRFTISTRSRKKGDVIEIYLDSNNLIRNMYEFTSLPLECEEGVKRANI
jgi:hypothetical protein